MGKLSILGAQRVKALQEILEGQKKAELALVAPHYPTRAETLAALEGAFPGITAAHDLVKSVFGEEPSSSYRNVCAHNTTQKSLSNDRQVERTAISEKYDDKARSLWLCETLEEAKDIVYGVKEPEKERESEDSE